MIERVGEFRLIQKIEKDVLGRIDCAAWPGEDGLEEIGLLRWFPRDALAPDRWLSQGDARRLAAAGAINDDLLCSLRSGVADGHAYDLYPYFSGGSLASLTRQATLHREGYPLEVALLIAGHLATGLSAAFRQEIDGQNLLHGFVTPYLVMISEEGAIKLCGVETAPALRELRGTAAKFAEILPYLSPESRGGEDPHPADDVYSLGALLYELLTLKRLASPSELRDESTALPSELRYFLARSVAPRFRRIQSVVEWLRELKAMVVQEGWIASAQDLSAFVAKVDDRVNPRRPDTSELTAADREIFARAIRKARAAAKAAPAEADPGEGQPRDDSSYQTTVIARDVLKPLAEKGKLVRTANVKIVYDP